MATDKEQNSNKEQVRRRLQDWGCLPETKLVLDLLRRRYPALKPYQLPAGWEQAHQLVGQQSVLHDLTCLADKGEIAT